MIDITSFLIYSAASPQLIRFQLVLTICTFMINSIHFIFNVHLIGKSSWQTATLYKTNSSWRHINFSTKISKHFLVKTSSSKVILFLENKISIAHHITYQKWIMKWWIHSRIVKPNQNIWKRNKTFVVKHVRYDYFL